MEEPSVISIWSRNALEFVASLGQDECVLEAFPAAIIPFPIATNFRLEIQVVPRKLTPLQMSWEALAIVHKGGDYGLDQGGGNEDGLKK